MSKFAIVIVSALVFILLVIYSQDLSTGTGFSQVLSFGPLGRTLLNHERSTSLFKENEEDLRFLPLLTNYDVMVTIIFFRSFV
jgi:hypothetical protein